MPLPLANAALQGLDTEGWVPLRHARPQSMWPSGAAAAPTMPGKWQLAPNSFLAESPFSTYEGEAMTSGALNLLSEGRTPLVVSVEREDADKAYERGTLVRVTPVMDAGGTVKPDKLDKVNISLFSTNSGAADAAKDKGYLGVISANVEKGQVEVAVSVGGVDLVRYTEADFKLQQKTGDVFDKANNPASATIVVGKVLYPGVIPLTEPQYMSIPDPAGSGQMSSAYVFSAYIDASLLTFFTSLNIRTKAGGIGATIRTDVTGGEIYRNPMAHLNTILTPVRSAADVVKTTGGGVYHNLPQRVFSDFEGWTKYAGADKYAQEIKDDGTPGNLAINTTDDIFNSNAYGPKWKKFSFADVLMESGLLRENNMRITGALSNDGGDTNLRARAMQVYTKTWATVSKLGLKDLRKAPLTEDEWKKHLQSGTMHKIIEANEALLRA